MNGIKKILISLLLIILALIILLPLLLTITNSFMEDVEIMENYNAYEEESFQNDNRNSFFSLKLIPDAVTLKQYYRVLVEKSKFLRMFWNSVFIVFPIVTGQVIISSMAAFVFAKLKFKGRDILFFMYIVVMMMPFQVTLVPNYIILDKLGLINKYLSIIYPGVFGAFGVFLLRQFMLSIPKEYIEAAKVDGCSLIHIFFKIVLPLSKGGIASLAILALIDNWNMVEQPLIFLKEVDRYPLSIYLSRVNSGELGIAFAAGIVYMLPVLFMFLYGENYLVEGISHSAIKR
ncbi:carbohydrate ABC transporter permease [Paramaledivibacter caminithermalis]|jgi:multiple sugar transport system permease protein|uniref:Carbohydrate ABC transporter membrane protein 2, CUT1 family (TC 3.A.1.1.-) n=1 Tax=Paramaledivibacter caminithermalis (strain DSM 15212 / CIP 107654 / DViRD3) TaxID=1121301 RepID=A0A1M6SD68_PARC5|nr:carbohydrate ABC transporter permease [Paramaledivibacter caminithermalis]SHK42626.1 carbohydrate ABC transporter membrane protein 2, CUT1 family (TC 3.A.1.1.-) [Paramaledivibacter caminithermalis DSM 15212]